MPLVLIYPQPTLLQAENLGDCARSCNVKNDGKLGKKTVFCRLQSPKMALYNSSKLQQKTPKMPGSAQQEWLSPD